MFTKYSIITYNMKTNTVGVTLTNLAKVKFREPFM